MKVSYNHLKTFVNFDLSPEKLSEILTSTGLEVEGIEKVESVKGSYEGLLVGEVITCEKHPDADRLKITTVNVGAKELLNIVCGAPNVAAGQKVIVATIGTTLYPSTGDSFEIKKSKIRGEASEGMICAEDEIGRGASHDGILILDTNLKVGTPLAEVFNIVTDYQIEIGLTPNRADAASHFGVARDIKAYFESEITMPSVEDFKLSEVKHTIDLKVIETDFCPRFCGLEIRNIEVKESPEWLKHFLKTIGVNSINNIVDITNYVCHYLGQPMHIFDADKISGNEVIVRVPEKDTQITTLDKIERKLSGFDLAICNAQKPMAIAGVFGGIDSGVVATTKNIFLEVAYFNPASIRKTATFHGLKTDASFRYERGTDPNMPSFAIKFAALLIQKLAGGDICDKLFDNYPNHISNIHLNLKISNIDRLIGKKIEVQKIISVLGSLDITVLDREEGYLKVSIPPYRVDVTREADVIEEILRIYGFDNVELSDNLSSDFISNFPEKNSEDIQVKLSEALAAKGLFEIQTLSIVNSSANQGFEESETIKLLNPLSEDQSEMRRSLLHSGLSAMAYNINRRAKDLKMFEFGRTYNRVQTVTSKKIKEQKIFGVWFTGNITAETWKHKSRSIVFSDLYQIVYDILSLFRISNFDSEDYSSESIQYGLSYSIKNKPLVKFGKVADKSLKVASIKQEVFYAEFDWEFMMKNYSPKVQFVEIPKFPEVRRDLSLVLEKNIRFEEIYKIARSIERKLIKKINVFDVYQGEKLEDGKKSYSISFILQDSEKTLNDTQIDKTMLRLISAFENDLGAIIRK